MYFYNKPLYSFTYLQTPAVSVYVKSFYCERHTFRVSIGLSSCYSSFLLFPGFRLQVLRGSPAVLPERCPLQAGAATCPVQLQLCSSCKHQLWWDLVYFGKCACLLSHWEPSQDFRCQQKTSFTHSGTKVDRFHTRSLYKVKRSDTKVTPTE